MREPTTSKDFRKLAWEDLKANQYWTAVGGIVVMTLICIAVFLLSLLLMMAVSLVFAENARQGAVDSMLVQYLPFGILSLVIAVPLFYIIGFAVWGQAKVALRITWRELKFSDVFSGYGHGWKMCWTYLVTLTYIQLWALLFVVPGVIKCFSYAMVPYIQVEHPDWTANACITESRRLMDGNKWRYFCLNFSFIGWILLASVASLVPIVGNLAGCLLSPYLTAAQARFYSELKCQKA